MNKPTHFNDLYASRFIKASDFRGQKVGLTIADVRHEELEGEKGIELKVIVEFQKTDRQRREGKPASQLVLAKINAVCLREMFGSDVREWIGKRVVFYPTNKIMPWPLTRAEKQAGKAPEECIRVWGSDQIERDVAFQFKPARRNPITLTLHASKPVEPRKTSETPTEVPEPPETPTHASSGDDEPFGGGDVNLDLDI